ncbi:MAG: c-type cytochrome [Burkholderiales bacterium]
MSANEKHAHESPIKTPRQLVTVVVLAFVVPIILVVLLVQFVTGGSKLDKSSPAMSPAAVAKRIRPVAEVNIGESAATQVPALASAAATRAAAGKPDGKKVYESTCVACHGTGVAGAPKFGDKAAWAPRIKTGVQSLYASALKGKNAMPPKGGNPALQEADVKAAVDYMAGAAK